MSNIEYHSEGFGRGGQPAIDVKDRTAYYHLNTETAHSIDALGPDECQAIYDGMLWDFWHELAPEIARRYGYGDVFSEGRSSGWLVVENPPDLSACDPCYGDSGRCADVEQWESFAGEIDALVEHLQREYPARLREAVEDKEVEQREREAMAARDIATID
jgi:hypothetical protein